MASTTITPLSLRLSLTSYLAIFTAVVYSAVEPVAADWSDQVFGPDGPWNAVQITLGGEQKISLYPGGESETILLTSDYCDHNSTLACYADQAGLYNKDQTGSDGGIQYVPELDYMSGIRVNGQDPTLWVDHMDVGANTIPNVSLTLLSESYMEYPDGTWYPQTVGCLGLGAPDTVGLSYTPKSGPVVNTNLIPGYLWDNYWIPSNSFAMHIGSANPSMAGSLYFGGYDQNRIVGNIITESGDYTKPISLRDITISVIDGSSPWDFSSKGGLLAANDKSISSHGLQVSVDGCSPYLSLPRSTCDAIAAELPVTYNSNLGLYIWNTDDEKYSKIVSSASALVFTFLGESNTQNVNISIPFRHLNLTLTAPLVQIDQQYFPCYTGPSKQYTLGRAFLQDAFLGANWNTKTWWLAQAPGPNVPSESIVQIAEGDTSITASAKDWKESWSGSWKALPSEEVSSLSNVSAPGATISADQTMGLSTGAQAGIGVGVAIAVLAIIGAVAFFFLKRRKARKEVVDSRPEDKEYTATQNIPPHGHYVPVKPLMSPGMTDVSNNPIPSPPSQGFIQQPYTGQDPVQDQAQDPPVQYSELSAQPDEQMLIAELPVGSLAIELPGSAPCDSSNSQSAETAEANHVSPPPSS
ncbi:aspartic peptidase domain-containing protein [Biscogniauxia sp. FL1348]|nr:aspartic peptidase domain-containing protein [Biscogniauxia sp. FL1348]